MRAIKMRAVREDRKLKDLIAELLRQGLAQQETAQPRHRVKLPILRGHPAKPGNELTPERAAEILIQEGAQWADIR